MTTTADATTTVAGIEVPTGHYIGGERIGREATFETLSPIDGRVLAEVARGGQREADLAVRAAHGAFPEWAALGAVGRAAHLHRLADLIDAHVEELAAVESADMAMLLRSLRARVIARGALNFRNYADLAVAYEERDWHSKGTWNRVQRMPAGPAAVITPWNAPFMLSTWKTRRRWRPAAPSCSSRPSGPRSRARCSPIAAARGRVPAGRASTSCRGSARRSAPRSSPIRCCVACRSPGRPTPRGRSASVAATQHRAVHRRARRQGAADRVRGRRP